MAKQKIFDAMEQDYAKEKPWLSLVLGALFALLIVFFILETLSGFKYQFTSLRFVRDAARLAAPIPLP